MVFRQYSIAVTYVLSIVACTLGDEKPVNCTPMSPPPGQKPETCCKIPELADMKGEEMKIKETFDSCMSLIKEKSSEIFPNGPPNKEAVHQPPLKLMECLQECVFNNTGMIKNGTVEVEAMKKVVLDVLGQDETWKPIAEEAIKKCSEISQKNVENDAVCKSGAHQLTVCAMREMYLSCPAASWSDSAWCKKEKALIERCPDFVMPSHRQHRHSSEESGH